MTDANTTPKSLPGARRGAIRSCSPKSSRNETSNVAKLPNGAKSALVEEVLDRRLNPEKCPLIDKALLRRFDEQASSLATLKRDAAINTEMISLFVRYFLTITPPLADSEQQPARVLGRQRFEVFVAQIGRRLASDQRLVSDVLELIAVHKPDLFATATDAAPLKSPPGATTLGSTVVSNGKAPTPSAEKRNGWLVSNSPNSPCNPQGRPNTSTGRDVDAVERHQ